MTQMQIRKKIDENNKIIKDLFSPNEFTLNNVIANLLEENRNLQKQCIHHFVNGYCEFCDKSEEKE